jgi:tetratricopeptide (TPR) repeat protein
MTEGERDAGPASALSYFSVLGIGEDAGQDELEQRYRELADHLASPAIPPSLRDWARKQAALVDEAYAVLADPESRAAARLGPSRAAAGSASSPIPADVPGSERRAPATAESPSGTAGEPPEGARARPGAQRAAASPQRGRPGSSSLLHRLRSQPLLLGVLVGLVALGAMFLVRFGVPGGGSESVPPAQSAGDLVPLDTERVAQLMKVIQGDPKNAEALFELGESYFLAGESQLAIDWFTELLTVDPNNVHARTDIGTAEFNLGRTPEAKASWVAALAIAPDDVQLHYNMGFLYANSEPQDLVAARQEWQKVVELAPDSNLGKTAKVHLDGITATPSGAATATPSGATATSSPPP